MVFISLNLVDKRTKICLMNDQGAHCPHLQQLDSLPKPQLLHTTAGMGELPVHCPHLQQSSSFEKPQLLQRTAGMGELPVH